MHADEFVKTAFLLVISASSAAIFDPFTQGAGETPARYHGISLPEARHDGERL
jgi:hypothetical protein